ncbi:HTH_Tnp_Tc3_2 domain-containing protein [Trichonephila clavipes]|nr:HTH_Tnp_Tc3_2 domain-containing protein [Trichonephila clavipes]
MSCHRNEKFFSKSNDAWLSGEEIGSRVGRNQTTVTRICDRWMKEGTTDQRGRSHPPQCTTSREYRQIVGMAVTDRSVTSRTIAQNIDDLSPIENMWSMVAQRLTQITSAAATPDQLRQRGEASWSDVPQEHIKSLFESMPRRETAVISNNGGY